MKTLSTTHVARLVGVSDQSVANWVDSGALRAGKTPGGHRRVQQHDLVLFLKHHKLRVPPELLASDTTILVIDDDPEVGQSIKKAIKTTHPDWNIQIATDGYAAGEAVATGHPSIVVLSLHMPGLDCLDVCRRIKSNRLKGRIGIIATTVQPSPEAKRAAKDAGAFAYLPKPIDLDLLYKKVQKLLPAWE